MTIDRPTWDGFIKALVLPHFRWQFSEAGAVTRFDEQADATFKAIAADRWTVERTEWCAKRMARTFSKIENLLAQFYRIDRGDKVRDGYVGGWETSDEYHAANRKAAAEQEQETCIAEVVDGYRSAGYCGKFARCNGCRKLNSGKSRAVTDDMTRAFPDPKEDREQEVSSAQG
jgi:hypothetical protein